MHSVRKLTITVLVTMLAVLFPVARANSVPLASLTLSGPDKVQRDVGQLFNGRLELAGIGLPAHNIDLLVDEQHVGKATTDAEGRFEASVVFPTPGEHRLIAVAHSGLPVELRSNELVVAVAAFFKDAFALSVGEYHACAIATGGSVHCWGNNWNGKLGDGSGPGGNGRSSPGTVAGLSDAVAIAAGGEHTCALVHGGEAWCWGAGWYGQLGDGRYYSDEPALTPVKVVGLSDAKAITTGSEHSCALVTSGQVFCWGDNWGGELGDGTFEDRPTPVAVSGISDAVAIAAGGYSTCAVLADSTVRCWGENRDGQLGDGTRIRRNIPTQVTGISGAVEVTTGGAHSCAVLATGNVKCWGANDHGQLGDGTTTDSLVPVEVSGISSAITADAGVQYTSLGSYTCALLESRAAACWGSNLNGRLGDGTDVDRVTPVLVEELSDGSEIGVGNGHSCSLVAGGVRCWGYNEYGQVGDGTRIDRWTPREV